MARLVAAAEGHDGAVLADGGQRHLAMAVTTAALERVRPDPTAGAPMRGLWARLELADVAATGFEAGDVDSWADLPEVLAGIDRFRKIGAVNLHDWIDELCDVLDIDTEVDEGLVLDLAKVVADNVVRKAAPDQRLPPRVRRRSQRGQPRGGREARREGAALAEGWDRPPDAKDPVDVDDEVPDDSLVDHTGDRFDD